MDDSKKYDGSLWKKVKTGRPKYFKTPQSLWKAACEYFQWCEDNPLMEVDYKGKDAMRVHVPKMRAMTISGMCLFIGVDKDYLGSVLNSHKGKDDIASKEFTLVVERIKETIANQKFEGAAAGMLNPMIIARDLGLAEKQQIHQRTTMALEKLDDTFKQLGEDEKQTLLSLAERLGYEDAEYEDLET